VSPLSGAAPAPLYGHASRLSPVSQTTGPSGRPSGTFVADKGENAHQLPHLHHLASTNHQEMAGHGPSERVLVDLMIVGPGFTSLLPRLVLHVLHRGQASRSRGKAKPCGILPIVSAALALIRCRTADRNGTVPMTQDTFALSI
jgi:hypothetical protein